VNYITLSQGGIMHKRSSVNGYGFGYGRLWGMTLWDGDISWHGWCLEFSVWCFVISVDIVSMETRINP